MCSIWLQWYFLCGSTSLKRNPPVVLLREFSQPRDRVWYLYFLCLWDHITYLYDFLKSFCLLVWYLPGGALWQHWPVDDLGVPAADVCSTAARPLEKISQTRTQCYVIVQILPELFLNVSHSCCFRSCSPAGIYFRAVIPWSALLTIGKTCGNLHPT